MTRSPLIAAALLLSIPAVAQVSSSIPPTISVVGSASREVEPDRATLTVGVVTEKAKAADAAAENSRAAQAMVAEIQKFGLDGADVQTGTLSLTPVYGTDGAAGTSIRGFRASHQVRVRVRRVDGMGPLLQRLFDKGVTSLSGPYWEVSNADALRDELRGLAAQDARRKAEIVAAGLGVKLGRVIEARSGGAPEPMIARRFEAALAPAPRAAPAPPIEAGTQRLSADLPVTFEIAPDK